VRRWYLIPVSEEGRNAATKYRPGPPIAGSFEEAFRVAFPSLDSLYRSFRTDGLLVAALVRGGTLETYLHIPLSQRPEFAIAGRHEQCDLRLEDDESVSLRHIAIAAARQGLDEIRIRVVDLQSGSGLRTEDGSTCEALIAEGPLFVYVGKYQLFFLPTGSLAATPWGKTALETWGGFPERVYLDRRIPARPWSGLHRIGADSRDRTIVTHVVAPPEPLSRRRLPGDAGARIATLQLVSAEGKSVFPIHSGDVARGILIGRYERCDLGVPDATLSRVHVLILEHDGGVWAVDTASTLGIHQGQERARQLRLGEATTFNLTKAIRLDWTAGR
jgi:hypothetical protein